MDGVTEPTPQVRESQPTLKRFRHITSAFNRTLLFSCVIIAVSQLNFGMDQGAFSATQAMTAFTQKFGVYNEKTKAYAIEPYFLSLLNSLTYIGFAFGLVTGSLVSRRWGRRMCMFVMCAWALIAATILVTSQTKEQMLAGRIIAYIYIGCELAVVPIYQSELVPARARGFVVGTYQLGIILGSLLMSIICRGTSDIQGDSSWRIPLGVFYVIPTVVACSVWFMPESPSWLLSQNRTEDALRSLQRVRRNRFSDAEISQEFVTLQETINRTVVKAQYLEILRGINLKRSMIVFGTNIFLQLTGQTFVSIYGTIYIASLGTINAFTMQCINSTISILVVLATMLLSDRTGRRPLMIIGAAVQTGALFALGGLGTSQNPSMAVKRGITACVSIFGAAFAFGWAPLSHVISAEIPTARLRDYTYATAAFFNIAIQFAVTFSIPYLLYAPYANLGSKVGFIFGSVAFFAFLFSCFCIPECSKKTLQEIDQLFLERTPIRQFKNARPNLTPVLETDNAKGAVHVEQTVV